MEKSGNDFVVAVVVRVYCDAFKNHLKIHKMQ